jgi:outer membrane protein assembly factor BamB
MHVLSSGTNGRLKPASIAAGRWWQIFLPISLLVCGHALAQVSMTNQWVLNVDICDSTPAIGDDGTLYLGSFHEKFWAVSSNGVVKWTFPTDSEIRSSAAIGSDGTIYFGCRDRKLYALDENGKKKWAFATGGWVDSSPALAQDGTIYFGSWDKYFYALKPDGSVKWRFETGGEIDSSPAVGADGTIYFGAHDKKFYALTPEGRKRWEFPTGGQIISSPALSSEGVIYFTSVDGVLHAVNPDGSARWQLRTGGITPSSPVIGSDGTIYLGVNEGLWAVTSDGKQKWNHFLYNSFTSSPTLVDGDMIYVVSPGHELFAFDPANELRWSVLTVDYDHGMSPAVDRNGTVYTESRAQTMVAVKARALLAETPWPKFRANYRNTGNVKDRRP